MGLKDIFGISPPEAASILEITDSDIHRASGAFEVLKELQASSQKGTRRGAVSVRVGATGGAKIMYALRPHALPPAGTMRFGTGLTRNGSADSYASFIRTVMHEVEELLADAAKHGVSRSQLPEDSIRSQRIDAAQDRGRVFSGSLSRAALQFHRYPSCRLGLSGAA